MSQLKILDKLVGIERKGNREIILKFKNGAELTIMDPDNLFLLEPGDSVTEPVGFVGDQPA